MSTVTAEKLAEGKTLVFQSRYRAYKKVLKVERLGSDDAGHGRFKTLEAKFANFMYTIDDTEENAELIKLLRKDAGRDFIEVDRAKKVAETSAKDKEIASLRAQLKQLENEKDKTKPSVVVRGSSKPS